METWIQKKNPTGDWVTTKEIEGQVVAPAGTVMRIESTWYVVTDYYYIVHGNVWIVRIVPK